MWIRQDYPIRDRVKLLLVLLFLLMTLTALANLKYESKTNTKTATIEVLLETALKPVGSTMYIWGGGWDGEDNRSGTTSTRLGLSSKWETFAKAQDESYDYDNHRYERENGLDCSGFVGWVLYNTFETENGKTGYVTISTDMAESLAERGWGTLIKNPREFLPGDIVSMEGHVWICMGTCEDGSVLLVHSSPPGVSICGTPTPRENEEIDAGSLAIESATEYMQKQHPKWQEKYPNRKVDLSYLQQVSVFRWSNTIMSDANELQNLSAEEIMRILSPDM